MRTCPKPLWLIARYRTRAMETLKIPLTTGDEALPVFSFEDEARMFLRLGKLNDDWRVRETGAGEIISMLYSLCVCVDNVVLDPLPAPFSGSNDLLSVEREAFMSFAAEQGCRAPFEPTFPPDLADQSSSDRRPPYATTRTATLERR